MSLLQIARIALAYVEDEGDGDSMLADDLRTAIAAAEKAAPAAQVPLTDEQIMAAFKAWHFKHGNNTQGIKWVDDLLWSCWKAAHGIGGKP